MTADWQPEPHLPRRRHAGRLRGPAAAQRRRRPPALRPAGDRRAAHRLGPPRPRRDVRRRDAPRPAGGGRDRAARPRPVRPQRPAPARHRRARPRDRRGRRVVRRDARRRLRRRHRLLALRGRLPRPAGPRGRRTGERPARRSRPRIRAVQRLPVLQVGRAPRLRRRRVGRGAHPRPARRPGAPDGRRLGLRLAQAQGRGAAARGRVRGDRGAARRLPVDAAAARPQRRMDARDVAQGRRPPGRGGRVPRGPDPGHPGHGRRSRRAPTCRSRPTCA